MADREQLEMLERSVQEWNRWRVANPRTAPDLSNANLKNANLSGAILRGVAWKEDTYEHGFLTTRGYVVEANLRGANMSGSFLYNASLSGANLERSNLEGAVLGGADLSDANLQQANLRGAHGLDANFSKANLTRADFHGAWLDAADFTEANLSKAILSDTRMEGAKLVRADLTGADLTSARIYGISAWDVRTDGAIQKDLIITSYYDLTPSVTVDDLEIAQFVYLLLNNKKIRTVIDTLGKKAVLILGRFTPDRKVILDALRDELRRRGYLPMLFDFPPSPKRNLTETIATLAHLSRFVIADITDARSIPQELQRIVPGLPSLPVQPILLASQYEYGMFRDFLDYPWVLEPYRYESQDHLLASVDNNVIAPAVARADEIERRRKAVEEQLGR